MIQIYIGRPILVSRVFFIAVPPFILINEGTWTHTCWSLIRALFCYKNVLTSTHGPLLGWMPISTGIGWYVVIMNVYSLKKHRYFNVFTCNISINDLVAAEGRYQTYWPVLITIFRNTHHVGDHHHQQNWKHLVLCVTKWKTISHSIH